MQCVAHHHKQRHQTNTIRYAPAEISGTAGACTSVAADFSTPVACIPCLFLFAFDITAFTVFEDVLCSSSNAYQSQIISSNDYDMNKQTLSNGYYQSTVVMHIEVKLSV